MTKANKITDVHQSPESGLGKTFLIGMATWPVSIGCFLTGRKRPAWLTREFVSSTRELKNICFAFGLATGGIAVTGSICGVGQWVVDEYLMPSKTAETKSLSHQKVSKNMDVTGAQIIPALKGREIF